MSHFSGLVVLTVKLFLQSVLFHFDIESGAVAQYTLRQNDVLTSMRRNHVALTLIRRHFTSCAR